MSSRSTSYLSVLLICALGGCSGKANPCSDDPAQCRDGGVDGGSDAGSTCAGPCGPSLSVAPDIILLWSGPQGTTPPDCPGALISFPGYLDAPPTTVDCSPCFCAPSKGSCTGPAVVYANTAPCPASEAMTTPFSIPSAWDGTCVPGNASGIDSFSPIHANLMQDLFGCMPSFSGGKVIQVEGATVAEVCTSSGPPEGTCPNPDDTCLYPQTEGFATCVWLSPDVSECPAGWPVKHPYYDNRHACECGCEQPVGESCTTTVTIYADGACAMPLVSAPVSLDFTTQCANLQPGSTVGSTSATPLVYQSGTCAPILKKSAEVNTLCCLP